MATRRWRWRWIAAALLLAIPLLLGAGLLLLHRRSVVRLAAHQRELAELGAVSAAATREADALLRSGRFDLAAVIPTTLLDRGLQQLVGYRQVTRRGNRFAIRSVEARFHEGRLEATANAWFDWRWGLYHGPIRVRYVVFSRLTPEGTSYLHFRVASVETLADWPLLRALRGWLRPILTLRLQRGLRIPNLELPLGVGSMGGTGDTGGGGGAGPAALPATDREVGEGGNIRVTLPERRWRVAARGVRTLLTREHLGVLVEELAPEAGAARPPPPPAGDPRAGARPDEARIALRLDRLGALIARVIEGPADLEVAVRAIPLPWERPGRIFNVEFPTRLELRRVRGGVDLERAELRLDGQRLDLALRARGAFAGFVEGELYGVQLSVPVKLRPEIDQVVPLRLLDEGGSLGLYPQSDIRLLLEVAAKVGVERIAASLPLELPAALLMRPLTVREVVAADLRVPTVVERGEVMASKPLPIGVRWGLRLPQRMDGMIEIAGEVELDQPGRDQIRRR